MSATNDGYKVFNAAELAKLAKKHSHTLNNLALIEKALNNRFSNMKDPIRALILAAVAGEPLLFVGPPGTAKSRLIRTFCQYIGVIPPTNQGRQQGVGNIQGKSRYFEYLLTPFTEPGELFGYFDIAKATRTGELTRETENMMQTATVVYLDEVFNGSSAILNSILSFLQERTFHDRGKRVNVEMEILFGATNQIPDTPELQAVFDRFLLRCYVDNAQAGVEDMQNLLMSGWSETYATQPVKPYPKILSEIIKLREAIEMADLTVHADDSFFSRLAKEVGTVRYTGQSAMSNRRLVKMLFVMVINAIYRAAQQQQIPHLVSISDKEIDLLKRFALDELDDEKSLLLENERFN